MNPHEVEAEIRENLSPEAGDYWNGCSRELIRELVSIGVKDGVDAAIAFVEEWAKPPINEYEIGGVVVRMTRAVAEQWNSGEFTADDEKNMWLVLHNTTLADSDKAIYDDYMCGMPANLLRKAVGGK